MNLENVVAIILGVIAIIAARSSPAALLAYAQTNKISTDRINELEKKVQEQQEDFEKRLQDERDACREKINVLAGVIADLIQDKAISTAHKKKLNDKLSLITDPKVKR